MSQRALVLTIADYLADRLSLGRDKCDAILGDQEGQPPPNCGEKFVCVHAGDWRGEGDENLQEVYGVNVTVTVRLPRVPADRWGRELKYKEGEGLDALLEGVKKFLHFDPHAYEVLRKANALIGTAHNGLVEVGRLVSGGRTVVRGSSWFWSEENEPRAGLSQTLGFWGWRRVQKIEEQG